MALIDNLVSYYKMEGNSNDSVGSNNGTDTSITYSAGNGKIDQGAGFNGSSSKIVIGNVLSSSPTNFTLSAWVKVTSLASARTIIADRAGSSYSYKYRLLIEASGLVRLNVYNESGAILTAIVTSTGKITTGTYFHIVATVTIGGTCYLYVNNVSEASSAYVTGSYPSHTNSSSIGVIVGPVTEEWHNGNADELGIWSRALSAAEVTELYNAGAGLTYPFMSNRANFLAFF